MFTPVHRPGAAKSRVPRAERSAGQRDPAIVPLLVVFIIVPIVEIALFIQVGGLIGLWPTLASVVLTAIVGTAVLRYQGLQVLRRAQASIEQSRVPVDSVMHGAFLLVAGLLLLTPGFFTDAVGFALLVPSLRLWVARVVWQRIRRSVQVHTGTGRSGAKGHGEDRSVIEGEAVEIEADGDADASDDSTPAARGARSPWRHRS